MAVRIGGQAVIEGVMMKNMDRYAVSVRKPNGKIETKVEECVSFAEKHPLFQLPVFRGMANFLESMVIGMKTLNYSASFYEDEEEQTESRTEQLLEKILGENVTNVAFGAHFCKYLENSKIPTYLYPPESLSKNVILTKDKVQITPSSFNLNPIKIIEL